MRAQVTIWVGLALLVAAAWAGLGRVGGAVALGVVGAVVLISGLMVASSAQEGGPDGRP